MTDHQFSAEWCRAAAGCIAELEQRLAAAEAALTEANRRLAEIRDELCGNNLDVVGWHLNGDLEPLDSWFDDNDWGPVEAAKGEQDECPRQD